MLNQTANKKQHAKKKKEKEKESKKRRARIIIVRKYFSHYKEDEESKGADREWSEKCRDWGPKKPAEAETLEKAYKNHPPGGSRNTRPKMKKKQQSEK